MPIRIAHSGYRGGSVEPPVLDRPRATPEAAPPGARIGWTQNTWYGVQSVAGGVHAKGATGRPGASRWPQSFALPKVPDDYKTSERLGGKVYDDGARKFIIHDGNAYAVTLERNGACRVIDPAARHGKSFYVVPTGENDHWKFGDWANLKGGGFGDPPDPAAINGRIHGLEDHGRQLMQEMQQIRQQQDQWVQRMHVLDTMKYEIGRTVDGLESRLHILRGMMDRYGHDHEDAPRWRDELQQKENDLRQARQDLQQHGEELSRIDSEKQRARQKLVDLESRRSDIENELRELRARLR